MAGKILLKIFSGFTITKAEPFIPAVIRPPSLPSADTELNSYSRKMNIVETYEMYTSECVHGLWKPKCQNDSSD